MINTLKGLLGIFLAILNTVVMCLLLYVVAIPKFLIPVQSCQRWLGRLMAAIAELWIDINTFAMQALHKIKFRVEGAEGLKADASYIVSANHQSWVDIVMLQRAFNRRIPFLRFFLKKNLIYVPFLGIAWWALDFPFMQRHSKEYLAKHPEKRGQDLETTRRSVQKFSGSPVSIINFLEGTRFNPKKKQSQKSPYEHLLNPKIGGLAFVIEAMGEQFDSLLDVTIFYPKRAPSIWELFKGDLDEILIRVRRIEIPRQFLRRQYQNDEAYRSEIQNWVQGLWREKDASLKAHRESRQQK